MKKINYNTKKNLIATTLTLLGVKHTNYYTELIYNTNPYKSNLLGISKMFTDYGVDNTGLKLSDKSQIENLNTPFIAHASNDFVIVKEVSHSSVKFIWGSGEEEVDRDEFNQIWSGVVLVLQSSSDSIEPGYEEHRKKEVIKNIQQFLLGVLLSILLIVVIIDNPYKSQANFLFTIIINIIGCYVSFLLVLKQINVNSNIADKLCSVFKKGDCNNVLESSASKFLGLISWSELGLGYFISNLLVLLFLPSYIPFLFSINILVLPYSVWSIWYQGFVARQWCGLCIMIQILLWAIFCTNVVFGFLIPETFSLYDALLLISIYTLPPIILNLSLPIYVKSKKFLFTEYQMKSLMFKPGVFFSKVKEQPFYEVDQSVSNIIFGNKNAQTTLTVLTNPYCAPCSTMHRRIEKLLNKLADKVNVQYIFTYFDTEDKEDFIKTIHNLIRIYLNNDIAHTNYLYNEWFNSERKSKFIFESKYCSNGHEIAVEEEFRNHELWKRQSGLRATPTVLVNGYLLPDEYKLEDLEYIIL
ncbi:vitamin K epoxide reductase family protein [Sphingobacterium bovisgrunnientis]|uniref:vitamin K epoxide reductase family protein n=1 Tax=Sphingobacterium bovisgrunnientis TaxID=1874697 RepID=UPI00135C2D51|nr:vitamin K epoxide reductase family protein [Sphingobacterium bovisgrunnientis]